MNYFASNQNANSVAIKLGDTFSTNLKHYNCPKTKYNAVIRTCGTSAGMFKFNFGSLNGYDVAGVCDKVKELLAKQNFDRLQSIFVGSTKNHIYGIQKHEIVEPIAGVAASAVYAKTQDWLNEKISKIASQYRAEHDHSGPITLNHDDKDNVFRTKKFNKDDSREIHQLEQKLSNIADEYIHMEELPPLEGSKVRQGDISLEEHTVKIAAQKLIAMKQAYDQFATENPTLARYGLSAFSVAAQGLIGLVGGPAGGVAGLINGIRGELTGEAINLAAGEQIAQGLEFGVSKGAEEFQAKFPSLTEEEARHLAGGSMMAIAGAAEGSTGIKQVLRNIDKKHSYAKLDTDPTHKNHQNKLHNKFEDNQAIHNQIDDYYDNILSKNANHLSDADINNSGPLPKGHSETFSGHKYSTYQLTEDLTVFRIGKKDTPLGEYFSLERPNSEIQSRIDKAIKHTWDSGTRSITDTIFEVKIPAGTKIHVGTVSTQGGVYVGGTKQVVITEPWNIKGVKVVNNYPIKVGG